MVKISRQLKWQREQLSKGKCYSCGKKRAKDDPLFCSKCRIKNRQKGVRRYRLKVGIPLDAPLSRRGRPRIVK